MTPKFAELVNPTFHYVLGLLERIEQGDDVDLPRERNAIRGELEDATMTAESADHPVALDDFKLAKRALVYWADEVMSFCGDPKVGEWWRENTLEVEYFGERNRAYKFYTLGETQARQAHPDVVEVWYLALVLGFKGDIGNAFREHLNRSEMPGGASDRDEAREHWAGELARQIRRSQLPDLQGEPLEGDVRPLTGGTRLAIAAACAGVLLIVLAVLVYFWLQKKRPDA